MLKIEKVNYGSRINLCAADRMGNIVCANQEDRRLLKLLVKIANTIKIPILFMGTPKSQAMLNAEFADGRRMLGERWLPFEANDPEWVTIIRTLWQYQYTSSTTSLTPLLEKRIYKLTQGIPAIAKALITFVQERVILNSTPKVPEKITAGILNQVANDELLPVRDAIRALRTKEGLDAYDDLMPKELPKPESWKGRSNAITLATTVFDNALVRESKKAAKKCVEHLFQEQDDTPT